MKKKKVQFVLLVTISSFFTSFLLHAQAKIVGAGCVIPGTEYQYNFWDRWDSAIDISICIEGGFFTADKSTCYKGKTLNSVRVTWNDSISGGKITISFPEGSDSFNVETTKSLWGGAIYTSFKSQQSKTSDIPGEIKCTPASGGSCAPFYTYQWEQSDDNFHWVEIKDAVSQNLSYPKTLNTTAFVRRRVTDNSSGSIAYSDASIIVIELSTEKN